eukprot:gene4339-4652_t
MNGILPLSNYMYLKALYTFTHGENWYDTHGWNFTDYRNNSPCLQGWFGIVAYPLGVDGSCLIIQIALENNNLRGILPSILANFTGLQVLSVIKNHLYGPLPIIRDCPMLRNLVLSDNAFTGPIPSNMLYDDDKNNTGNNTNSFLDTLKLQYIQFSNNHLTNTLPSWIYSIKSLYRLSLDHNDLTGTISHEIINLMNINLIYLNNNRFSGTLPIDFLFLKRLSAFVITSNFLSGTIKLPSSLMNPTSLRILNIADNNFEGLLPSVEGLTKIFQVVFYSNYFSGTIDKSYCNFKGPRLSLSDNLLSGTVPSCIWKNNLIQLELDYNQFHGSVDFPVPDASNFKSFKTRFLSLGYNYFSGTFPWHILYYPDLYGVSASNNCFSNDISSFHCNQTISESVHVSSSIHIDNLYSLKRCHSKKKKKSFNIFVNNQRRSFGGKFPACLLLTTKINEIFASGNGFTGTIPSNSFIIDRPSPLNLNLSYNYLTGTIPLITSNFHSLDLSYNKFYGNININNTLHYSFLKNNSSLILKKNRLSGKMNIIQSIDYYDKIEIAEGNMLDSVIIKIVFELIVQRRKLSEYIHGTEVISVQREVELEFNPISSALDKSDHSVENQQLERRSEEFKSSEVQSSSSSSYYLVTEIKEGSQATLNMENLAILDKALSCTPYCTTSGIWMIVNLSLLFNTIILFDIVGDVSGAETALWL